VGNFFSYGLPTFYQFRAHIYQARELPNEDASGESDPYIQVAFGHHSGRSIIVQDNSCPTFDQVWSGPGIRLWYFMCTAAPPDSH
jgi:hypothetical protein